MKDDGMSRAEAANEKYGGPSPAEQEFHAGRLDRMVDDLARPIYVLRNARAQGDRPGADVRAANARRDIEAIVTGYVNGVD